MDFIALKSYDPKTETWHQAIFLPRELKKTLAWKLALGHTYFRIQNVRTH